MINPGVLYSGKVNAPDSNYSYGSARNVTTPGDLTGTPWDEALVNDWFGFQQAMLLSSGIVPSGSSDTEDDSDLFDAISATLSPPGTIVAGAYNDTPSNLGLRLLLLDGSGILVANYPDLVSNTYVGDSDNASVGAAGGGFYKSSDAAGATPDIAGPYFKLPDARGQFLRGFDLAGTIDPDGAGRFLGDIQDWAVVEHQQYSWQEDANKFILPVSVDLASGSSVRLEAVSGAETNTHIIADHIKTNATVTAARVSADELRSTNISTDFFIRF